MSKNIFINIDSTYRDRTQFPNPADFIISVNNTDINDLSSRSSIIYPPQESSEVYSYPLHFTLSQRTNSLTSGMSYINLGYREYINYSNVVEIDSIQNTVEGTDGIIIPQLSIPRTNGTYDTKYFELINDDEFFIRTLDLDAVNGGVGCALEPAEYYTQTTRILNTNYTPQQHVLEFQYETTEQGASIAKDLLVSVQNPFINNQIQIYLNCFSSSIDNYYKNKTITIDDEEYVIIAYDGLKRLATLNRMLPSAPTTETSYYISQSDKWELQLQDQITPFFFSIDDISELMSPNNIQNTYNMDLVIKILQTRRHVYRIRNDVPVSSGRIDTTQTLLNQITIPSTESVKVGQWLWIHNKQQRLSPEAIFTGCLHSLGPEWDQVNTVSLDYTDYVEGGAYVWTSGYLAYSPTLDMTVSPAQSQSTTDGITWDFIIASRQFTGVCWSTDLGIFVLTGSTDYGGGQRFLTYDGTTATMRIAPAGTWTAVTRGGGGGFMDYFIVLEPTGAYCSSPDGVIWTLNGLGGSLLGSGYNWIAFSEPMQMFVAVSSTDNRIQKFSYSTSTGLYGWTYSIVHPATVSYNIAYIPFINMFVAVGAGDGIYTSTRAEYWTQQTSPVSGTWRYITYTDNLYDNIIIVNDGASLYIYSLDGYTWSSLPVTGTPPSVTGAIIWAGDKVITQQDTVNTSFVGALAVNIQRPFMNTGTILNVYLWINYMTAVSGDDMVLQVYTTWGRQSVIDEDKMPLITGYVGGKILSYEIIPATYNLHSCMNFRPINNYTNIYTPIVSTTHTWSSIVWAMNKFIAVSGDGDEYRITYSADGLNWYFISTLLYSWSAIASSPSRFVIISSGGEGVGLYSDDGITWSNSVIPGNAWQSIVWTDSLFVAVASSGADRVMTSPDGITWTSRASANEAVTWKQVVWSGTRLVAVGDTGAGDRVMYSDNGIVWTTTPASDNTKAWISVAYGNSRFVAVNGTDNIPMVSVDDGVTWTDSTTPATIPGDLNPIYVYWVEARQIFIIFIRYTNLFPTSTGYKITGLDGNYWELDSAFGDPGATCVTWSSELYLLASVKNYPNFFVNNSFISISYNPPQVLHVTIQGGVPVSFINTTPGIELYQPVYSIVKNNPNYNEYRYITSVDTTTNTVTVNPELPSSVSRYDTFDILDGGIGFTHSLDIYPIELNVCYDIDLVSVILPNKILQTGYGNRVAFYPYIYVEFSSMNNPTESILWSNNPNSTKCLFKVPVYNVQTPETTKFVRLDGRGMRHTITFKYNDVFRVRVLLPNGEVFDVGGDTIIPVLPDPDMQISYTFIVRKH